MELNMDIIDKEKTKTRGRSKIEATKHGMLTDRQTDRKRYFTNKKSFK